MDTLKNFANKASGPSNTQQPAAGNNAGQKEDYLDKAFDMGSKKAGYNVDRNTSEKITDGARKAYESATGKKVDPKFSN